MSDAQVHPVIKHDIDEELRRVSHLPSIKRKNILVSGGAGFLGSHFCDLLHELGAHVYCVDNFSTGAKYNVEHLLESDKFKLFDCDVSDPIFIDTVEPMINEFDYVLHLASIASPKIYQDDPIATLDSGVLGTKNMLEIARRSDATFLLTSTSEVYGDPPDEKIPTPETYCGNVSSIGPRSMYDESKRVAEAYTMAYHKKMGVDTRIARIFNTYGPRLDLGTPEKPTSQYGRALVRFVDQALKGNDITIYFDGNQTRSFCYVSDQIVGLTKLLLTPEIDGKVVNIGNGRETTINDLVDKIMSLTGSNSKVVRGAIPNYDIRNDPRRRCPDISKAERLLGYTPEVSLEEGLRRTIEWYKDVCLEQLYKVQI